MIEYSYCDMIKKIKKSYSFREMSCRVCRLEDLKNHSYFLSVEIFLIFKFNKIEYIFLPQLSAIIEHELIKTTVSFHIPWRQLTAPNKQTNEQIRILNQNKIKIKTKNGNSFKQHHSLLFPFTLTHQSLTINSSTLHFLLYLLKQQ